MASSLDEDKLEKAVAFLLHPSVRGSDDEAKRSFLQNKGLSSEEIAEAFRRTADGTSASADRDGGTGMHLNTAPIPSSSTATMDSSRVGQMQNIAPPRSGVSYTNILVGIGFAAAAAYSIKTIFGPSISRTIDAVKSSLQGAHDNTSSQNGLTIVEVETDDDGSYTTNNTNNTNIENKNSGKNDRELVEAIRDQTEQLRQSMELLIRSSNAGHDSISELREEVKILNDRLQHGVVPGMTGVTGSKSVGQNGLHHHAHMNDMNDESTPMSYMQVLEMLEQGRPIPGIRDDIDDKPPNPDLSPTASKMQRRAKPWEKDEREEYVHDALNDFTEYDAVGSSGTTPSRRDLSGARPSNSIYESVTKTPDKHQAVVAEKEATEGRPSPSSIPWRPPPMPMASLDAD